MDNNLDKLLIEVYDGTNQECESDCSVCGASGCNSSMSTREMVDMIADELQKTFGNSVEIRYIDTNTAGPQSLEVCREVIEAGYRYPVTVINGRPRAAGGLNIYLIRQLLDQIAFELLGANQQPAANS